MSSESKFDPLLDLSQKLGSMRQEVVRLSVTAEAQGVNLSSLSKVVDSIGVRIEDLEDILDGAHKKATKVLRRWTTVLVVVGSIMLVSAVLSILRAVGVIA